MSANNSLKNALQCLWTMENAFGHLNSSFSGKSVDAEWRPIPWYTYPAVEYVSSLDFSGKDILEWGCGNSTLFWAARARSVTSIEDNEGWHSEVSKSLPSNAQVLLRKDEDSYLDTTSLADGYDVVIIDGKYRRRCAERVPALLKPGGMVVLDNADRHPVTTRYLRDMDLLQVDFSGFGPINNYTWTTSIFLKRDFNINRRQPGVAPQPIGGLRELDD